MKTAVRSPVLLYHAVYETVPSPLENRIHNVNPETFYKQMKWLKENYDIVSIMDNPLDPSLGIVSVTFDDGNRSVYSQAVPVLESMSIPATVFPIGCTFSGSIFWRDKLRLIMYLGLEKEFILHLGEYYGVNFMPFRKSLLDATKEGVCCDAILDKVSDELLGCFMDLKTKPDWHSLETPKRKPSTLLRFGNHTFSHYRQSVLSPETQEFEITQGEMAVRREHGRCEKALAIPFGRVRDLGSATLRISKELEYQMILFCEQDWSEPTACSQDSALGTLRFVNRLKAPNSAHELQRLLITPAESNGKFLSTAECAFNRERVHST